MKRVDDQQQMTSQQFLQRRRRLGLSRAKLAERAGVSAQTIYLIESMKIIIKDTHITFLEKAERQLLLEARTSQMFQRHGVGVSLGQPSPETVRVMYRLLENGDDELAQKLGEEVLGLLDEGSEAWLMVANFTAIAHALADPRSEKGFALAKRACDRLREDHPVELRSNIKNELIGYQFERLAPGDTHGYRQISEEMDLLCKWNPENPVFHWNHLEVACKEKSLYGKIPDLLETLYRLVGRAKVNRRINDEKKYYAASQYTW